MRRFILKDWKIKIRILAYDINSKIQFGWKKSNMQMVFKLMVNENLQTLFIRLLQLKIIAIKIDRQKLIKKPERNWS